MSDNGGHHFDGAAQDRRYWKSTAKIHARAALTPVTVIF